MFTIKPMNTLPPRMTLSLIDHTGYLPAAARYSSSTGSQPSS